MTIKITPKEELTTGCWFVRRIQGEAYNEYGPWCIGTLSGEFPFLYGRVHIFDSDQLAMEYTLSRASEITNPNEWQFGPRIEFPPNE